MKELQIGGVYRLDRRRDYHGYGSIELWDTVERVMCYDQFEVFVDIELGREEGDWMMDKMLKGHCYFGRRSTSFFEDYGKQIDYYPVSDAVTRHFRLDLPFRISRIKDLDWFNPAFESEGELEAVVNGLTSEQWRSQTINSSSMYINAGGDSGGFILLTADNGSYFTALELLKKGRQVIKPKHKSLKGVGIFRSGARRGVPVYYVGEYYDRAGFLKDFEDMGIDTNV